MIIAMLIPSLVGGGAERQFIQQARSLTNLGHTVYVITLKPASLEDNNIFFCSIDLDSFYDPRCITRTHKLLRFIRPNYIYTWFRQFDLIVFMYKFFGNFRWVIAERSSSSCYVSLSDKMRRLFGLFSDKIITNSIPGVNYWKSNYLPSHPQIYLIPNCYQQLLDNLPPSSCSFAPSTPVKSFVFIGRLVKSKNIKLLLKLLLTKNLSEYTLRIIGEGPNKLELQKFVLESGLSSRVEFLGYLDPAVLTNILCSKDVVVSLSQYEGQSNVVDETIISKRPIILSDIPSHRFSTFDSLPLVDLSCDIDLLSSQILSITLSTETREYRRRLETVSTRLCKQSTSASLQSLLSEVFI